MVALSKATSVRLGGLVSAGAGPTVETTTLESEDVRRFERVLPVNLSAAVAHCPIIPSIRGADVRMSKVPPVVPLWTYQAGTSPVDARKCNAQDELWPKLTLTSA